MIPMDQSVRAPKYNISIEAFVDECTLDYNAGVAVTDDATDYQNYMDTHYADAAKTESHMAAGSYAQVVEDSNYLVLRSTPEYAYENEIEPLYNGETVEIPGGTSGSYVYVCAESGNCGWVNAGFLY